MWAHPGKKLLFMGGEVAQQGEWNHDAQVEWHLLDDPDHRGVQRLVRDLNRLHRTEPALHALDAEPAGFRWVIGDDRDNSIFAFLRFAGEAHRPILAVCNMTPVPRHAYRIGVPTSGIWRELVNTDAAGYGGSNLGNSGEVHSQPVRSHGEAQSLDLVLPPMATLLLRQDA
jgi:1,4-alpha-glucan branching enzyme